MGDADHQRQLHPKGECEVDRVRHAEQYDPATPAVRAAPAWAPSWAPAAGRPFWLAFAVAPLVALAIAAVAPVPLAVGAIAVFGVAHLGLESRYVIGRFSPVVPWRVFAWLLVPLSVIAVVRLAQLGPKGTRIEASLALAMLVGGWAWCTRRRWVAAAVGALALAGLAVPALRNPAWYAVVVAHLHNLTPVAFLWEWSRDRGTRAGRTLFRAAQLGWAVVIPALVLSGVFDRGSWGLSTWGADRTAAKVAAVYTPAGWGGEWPLRFLIVFCFGQLMHYVIWCGFLPAVARAEHANAGSVPGFGAVLRPRVFGIGVLVVAAVVGVLQLTSGPEGRRIYAGLASYHAYLEYPLLMLMLATLVAGPLALRTTRSTPTRTTTRTSTP